MTEAISPTCEWTYPRAGQVPATVLLAGKKAAEAPGVLCVLFVPHNASATAPNSRAARHWGNRAREVGSCDLAAQWAWREAGEPAIAVPVTVDVIRFGGAVMDDANVFTGLKRVRDWLCGFGRTPRLVPDDSPRWWLDGELRQITGPEWRGGRAWTVLVVRRRETGS